MMIERIAGAARRRLDWLVGRRVLAWFRSCFSGLMAGLTFRRSLMT
jgi:hypothetical protein